MSTPTEGNLESSDARCVRSKGACSCSGRTMGPREWLAVGLRLLGAWNIAEAFHYIGSIVVLMRNPPFDQVSDPIETYSIYGGTSLVIGTGLIVGANLFARLVTEPSRGSDAGPGRPDSGPASR